LLNFPEDEVLDAISFPYRKPPPEEQEGDLQMNYNFYQQKFDLYQEEFVMIAGNIYWMVAIQEGKPCFRAKTPKKKARKNDVASMLVTAKMNNFLPPVQKSLIVFCVYFDSCI
jgi:hypothetical protein